MVRPTLLPTMAGLLLVIAAYGAGLVMTRSGEILQPATEADLAAAWGGGECLDCGRNNVDCDDVPCVPVGDVFWEIFGSGRTQETVCETELSTGWYDCETGAPQPCFEVWESEFPDCAASEPVAAFEVDSACATAYECGGS